MKKFLKKIAGFFSKKKPVPVVVPEVKQEVKPEVTPKVVVPVLTPEQRFHEAQSRLAAAEQRAKRSKRGSK